MCISVNQLSLLSPLNDKQTQRQIPSRGQREEKCGEGRQGQKALKEMKLNPAAPLTEGTRIVILEQVFPLSLSEAKREQTSQLSKKFSELLPRRIAHM